MKGKEPSIVTSVRIPVSLWTRMRERGEFSPSHVLIKALEAILDEDADSAVKKMIAEREAKMEAAVLRASAGLSEQRKTEADKLRPEFEKYVAGSPKTTQDAKVRWINARKVEYPVLAKIHGMVLLKELEARV